MSAALRCDDVAAQASRYLDGTLDARTRAAVQEHLRTCGACLRAYRGTLQIARAARALPRRAARADLAVSVEAIVAARRTDAASRLGDAHHSATRRVVAAACALCIATLAGFVLGRCTTAPNAKAPEAVPRELAPRETQSPQRPARDAVPSHPPRLTPAMDAVPASAPARPTRSR